MKKKSSKGLHYKDYGKYQNSTYQNPYSNQLNNSCPSISYTASEPSVHDLISNTLKSIFNINLDLVFKECTNHSIILNNSQNYRHSFFVPHSIDLKYSQKTVNKNHHSFTQADSVTVEQISTVHDKPTSNLNLGADKDQLTTSDLADSVTVQQISAVHDQPTSNLNLGADKDQLTTSDLVDSVTVQQINAVHDQPTSNLNFSADKDQLTTSNLADSVTVQQISAVHDQPTSNLNLGADKDQLTTSDLADSVTVQQINAVYDQPTSNLNLGADKDQLNTSNLADSVTVQQISAVHDQHTSNLNLSADKDQLNTSNLTDSVAVQQISKINDDALSVSASSIGALGQAISLDRLNLGINSDSSSNQNNVIHSNPPTIVQDRTSEKHLKLDSISRNNLISSADVSDSCNQLINAMATLNSESTNSSYFNAENSVNRLSLIY